jgi:ABC-type maltose transport system permease subunit
MTTFNTMSSPLLHPAAARCVLDGGYALARLNVPFRKFFLAGVLVMHAFLTVTLIIAIFLILQVVGLYNHIGGVILAKTALDRRSASGS